MIEKTDVLHQHLATISKMNRPQRMAIIREKQVVLLQVQAAEKGVTLPRGAALDAICEAEARDLMAGIERDVDGLEIVLVDGGRAVGSEPSVDG